MVRLLKQGFLGIILSVFKNGSKNETGTGCELFSDVAAYVYEYGLEVIRCSQVKISF